MDSMARVTEGLRSPNAVDWWQKIVNLDPKSVTNRLDFARAALMFGNYPRAGQALAGIAPADQNTATFQQLAGMVAAAENNLAKADWHFSRAAELDPQNKSFQFNQAVIHLQAKNPELVRAAEQTMIALAADPLFRKNALRHLTLMAIQKKDFAAADKFAADLQDTTDATFDDRLLRLSILRAAGSPDFAGQLARIKTDVATNADNIYTVAAWLAGHDLGPDALHWLGQLPDAMLAQPVVRMARADTLMNLRDWPGLQAYLADQDWNDLEFIRLAQLARAAQQQNQSMVFQASWQNAVRAAGEHLYALSLLTRLATAWGLDKEREDLLWNIVQRYPGERWALKALNQFYTASGDTRGLQKVFTTLLDYDNTDPVAQNNLASVLLLLNTQAGRAYELAHTAYLGHTNIAAFATTYAYSLHVQGHTAEGLKILKALPAAQLETPGIAIYYGVLLAAAGEANQARKYLDLAAAAPLLPEEKELIRAARAAP